MNLSEIEVSNALPIIALLLAVLGYFQAMKIIKARIFVEYTKRFTEIEAEIHGLFRGLYPELDTPEKMAAAKHIAGMKYLNLCSEEFHLFSRGLVDREVWGYWSAGIPRFLNMPEFKDIAEGMVTEFALYYPKFHNLLVKKLNERSPD